MSLTAIKNFLKGFVIFKNNGTAVNSVDRRNLNLIPGTNVTISAVDNPGSNQVDVTVNSSGSSTNIYNSDGTLTANRVVTMNGKTLDFTESTGVGYFYAYLDNGGGDGSGVFINNSSININSSNGGSNSQVLVTPTAITINSLYTLPSTSPAVNNVPYCSSAGVLGFTALKTVNSNSLIGSGNFTTPYTLSVQALTSSPADGQTIYFGNLPKAPVTVAATSKVYIPRAGTIKRAEIYCYSGTPGTNQAWSGYIRLNNTTDTLIATLSVATSERVFSNSALSIAVVAGDYFEIKFINPTWATNPLTTIFGGYIYIE
jgi:hypothetical protein